MRFLYFYFSAVLLNLFDFSTHDVHKNTDCPLLQKGVKRTRKTVTLETKTLVIIKLEAGEKRATLASQRELCYKL